MGEVMRQGAGGELPLRKIRSVLLGSYCLFSENVRFKFYMSFIFELSIEKKGLALVFVKIPGLDLFV